MNEYPSENQLQKIEKWEGSLRSLAEYVCSIWNWKDYATLRGRTLMLHTGGWSGNEDIVGALRKNLFFWGCCWRKSERGGHYKFVLPPEKKSR
jgi:hypothetical protein